MPDAAERSLAILARHPDGSVEELAEGRIDESDQLTDRAGTLVWVSCSNPTADDIAAFAREFRLHPLAVEDVRKREQRPRSTRTRRRP